MTTGTPRIALGIVLIAALVLFALRGVLVLVLGVLTGGDGSYLLGTVIGIVIVSVLIVLVLLRVLAKGLAQRRAYLATRSSADPLAPSRTTPDAEASEKHDWSGTRSR